VGVTAGSREIPGTKPVTRDNDEDDNNNINNNIGLRLTRTPLMKALELESGCKNSTFIFLRFYEKVFGLRYNIRKVENFPFSYLLNVQHLISLLKIIFKLTIFKVLVHTEL
jgi:hypothetical protein